MAFTINTNIASLQSQEYLRINTEFQQKTINRVTSGLRIVSSGDDAAGLAIANGFRSDRTVLTQGVRNANDGLSTLQTIDGGINNISQLLDRARTLATQSASGTFTGDRAVLNSEFQNVISEIDRQAKLIGLDAGGIFAAKLSVFIGGGRGATTAEQIANGKISVDLSTSNIDTKGLGLSGQRVSGALANDIDEILTNTTNQQSLAVPGWTQFYFRGAGFSDSERATVSVNLSGVDNDIELVTAINSALDQAGSASEQFRAAGIRAKLVRDNQNNTRLIFESSNAAFQVAAGDRLANALLGNHVDNVGNDLKHTVTGASSAANGTVAFGTTQTNNIIVRVQGGSLASPVDLTLDVTTSTATTVSNALTSLSSLVANNSKLQAAGITVVTAAGGSPVKFVSSRGEDFEVSVVNDENNRLGMGTAISGSSTSFDVTTVTAESALATSAGSRNLYVSIGGGAYRTLTVTNTSSSAADVVNELNSLINADTVLQRAGLQATYSGSQVVLQSNNGSYLRVTGDATFGFASVNGSTLTGGVYLAESFTTPGTVNSGGAYGTSLLSFAPIRAGDDDQVITVGLKDSSGNNQAVAITLKSDGPEPSGRSIDEALHYINQRLQDHDNADVRKVVAVKERDVTDGVEKIRFLSPSGELKISIGTTPGGGGISSSAGPVVAAQKLPGGADIDIETLSNAEAAVSALAEAVVKLGAVQAVVGRGQNQLNFAISIAQTQIINLNASESRIRDADLAAEAANLSRAQVLQQAGIAALAQANATPQAVLTLLRG
jgi:flagellin